MKKYLTLCLLISILLIPIARAATCDPTISWAIDSQFFTGETGKLIATLNNPCGNGYNVKAEVNAGKAQGYVKVYTVLSEDQKPMPRSHSIQAVTASATYFLERKDIEGSKKEVIFFIQPDELALPGTYSLFENFYIEGVLKDSKEVQITVKKPIQITHKLPSSIKLGTPSSSSISINNIGTEMITSLKMCLSSPNNVVSFSDSCRTWADVPSKYTDTFNFIMTGLIPGSYRNAINIKTDYTTYTGLTVSESYNHPSLMITAEKSGTPSLSYSFTRENESLTLRMTNKGNGTAYNCIARIISPAECLLNSSYLTSYSKVSVSNVYEIECGNEIPVKTTTTMDLTFNPNEINSSCTVKGLIYYKDGTGKNLETQINDFYIKPATTPSKPLVDRVERKNILYIVLIVVVVIIVVVVYLLKYRRKEVEDGIKRIKESIKRIKEMSSTPKT